MTLNIPARGKTLARRLVYPVELRRLKHDASALTQAAKRCRAVLLCHLGTGQTLWTSHAEARVPIASLTKMMTALLALEAIDGGTLDLNQVLFAGAEKPLPGTVGGLRPGRGYTVSTLLDLLFVRSANDAARLLATAVGGSEEEFVAMMNRRAMSLGLSDTAFFNPHGLQPVDGFYWVADNVSSARDMASLAGVLIAEHPDVLRSSAKPDITFDGRVLPNTNMLMRRCPGVDGLKTGASPTAGHCLVATCVRPEGRLLCVVLGAPNNEARDLVIHALFDGGYVAERAGRVAQTATG